MKNIHVLKTDKPSRLVLNSITNDLFLTTTKKFPSDIMKFKNIYITSNEEIGTDEYYFHLKNNEYYNSGRIDEIDKDMKFWRKIILTTDQDLIKDGVQAIDDKFLEWFVKNPSCEEVEVIRGLFNSKGEKVNIIDSWKYYSTCFWHKIIIPKEEPKQDWFCPKCDSYVSSESVTFEETHQICNTGVVIKNPKQETLTNDTSSHSWGFENFEVIKTEEDAKIFVETMENIPGPNDKLKKAFRDFNKQETLEKYSERFNNKDNEVVDGIFNPENWGRRIVKQETIEEAAENYGWRIKRNTFSDAVKANELAESAKQDFIAGAKWQAERMYSEEEVLEIIDSLFHQYASFFKIDAKEYFLQFKNK